MKFVNVLLIYSILLLFLVFPINILGENLSNHLRKDPGGNFRNNIQRKLQEDNYIIFKYNDRANYSTKNFTILENSEDETSEDTRQFISKIIYNNNSYNDINFIIEANKVVEIHFSKPMESLASLFDHYFDSNCNKISYVDLYHFDSSALNDIEYMFYECTSIQEINFTNFNTASVKYMNNMFDGCSQLISLNISNFNTSIVEDMNSMFNGCTNLVSLDLSNFDGSSVTDCNAMFQNCRQLKSIDSSNLGAINAEDIDFMFSGCSSLEYLELSNFNPDSDNLMNIDNMFDNVTNIKYINIYNIQNEKLKTAFVNKNLNTKEDLIICQSENILNNSNAVYECCDFSKRPLQCESNNYKKCSKLYFWLYK